MAPRGNGRGFTPAEFELIAAWCSRAEMGRPRCFRKQIESLAGELGVPPRLLYSTLRRDAPTVLGRLTRIRQTWYTHRDALIRGKPDSMTWQDLAAQLGMSVDAVRQRRRALRRNRKKPAIKDPESATLQDALDAFEEAVETFEGEVDLPYRTLPAVAAGAAALKVSIGEFRRAVMAIRPDLWQRYQVQLGRYRKALAADIASDLPAVVVADRFELSPTTIRGARKRLRATKNKERKAP